MRTPKVEVVQPQEDPADKAARQAEQARAEASRIADTQGILSLDTLRRLRRFGATAKQSIPIASVAATAPGSSGATGGGSSDPVFPGGAPALNFEGLRGGSFGPQLY